MSDPAGLVPAPAPAIADGKIVGYLLNVDHPEGGPKARYFLARGFRLNEPKPFIAALFDHSTAGNLMRTSRNEFGTRYVYEGPLPTPDGLNPRVRSVWQHADGDLWRFLVTAYPF